jgi:hypothetical protein
MSTRTRPARTTRFRRLAVMAMVTGLLSLGGVVPASAYAPVGIVHTERVQAGPYMVTVGFSTWPIRAMKSLDFTFVPDGGIAGKRGRLLMDGPGIQQDQHVLPLMRHPRKRDAWGLDVKALNTPGTYSFGFQIAGPQGVGQGILRGVTVLNQPGPPLPLSWTIGSLPFVGLIAFLVIAWRRTKPGREPLTI